MWSTYRQGNMGGNVDTDVSCQDPVRVKRHLGLTHFHGQKDGRDCIMGYHKNIINTFSIDDALSVRVNTC